jgi:hypothetical protein
MYQHYRVAGSSWGICRIFFSKDRTQPTELNLINLNFTQPPETPSGKKPTKGKMLLDHSHFVFSKIVQVLNEFLAVLKSPIFRV